MYARLPKGSRRAGILNLVGPEFAEILRFDYDIVPVCSAFGDCS